MTELSLILSVLLAVVFILWMRAHKGWTAERERWIDLSNIMRQPKIEEVRERVFADERSRVVKEWMTDKEMAEAVNTVNRLRMADTDEWPEILEI